MVLYLGIPVDLDVFLVCLAALRSHSRRLRGLAIYWQAHAVALKDSVPQLPCDLRGAVEA